MDVKQHFIQQAQVAVCHEDVLEDPTVLDMPESREMSERTDWQAKQPSPSGLCLARFEVSRSLTRYLRAQCRGHHISQLFGEREGRRLRKRSTVFLEWTRKGHHQSDEHWNCPEGISGDILES